VLRLFFKYAPQIRKEQQQPVHRELIIQASIQVNNVELSIRDVQVRIRILYERLFPFLQFKDENGMESGVYFVVVKILVMFLLTD